MVRQTEIFDLGRGEEEREKGKARGRVDRKEALYVARQCAAEIAMSRRDRTVTADDVQAAILRRGITPEDLGPAAGSIFRGPDWECTGAWVNSARVSNHAASIRVWRYTGGGRDGKA